MFFTKVTRRVQTVFQDSGGLSRGKKDISCTLCTTLLFRQPRIMLILPFCTVFICYCLCFIIAWLIIMALLYKLRFLNLWVWPTFLVHRCRIQNLIIKFFLFELAQCSKAHISSSFIIHSVFSSALFTVSDFMFTSCSLIKHWTMMEVTMPMGCQ